MIEMSVEFVRVSMQNYNRVVILKEKESERYLLIWIGPAEASAIALAQQKGDASRSGGEATERSGTTSARRNVPSSLSWKDTYTSPCSAGPLSQSRAPAMYWICSRMTPK